MKIKCNDGVVRRFQIAKSDGEYLSDGTRIEGNMESVCLECGYPFDVHDTKILKPIWREHICKKSSS